MNEVFEAGLKDIARTIIKDSLRVALHESATDGWYPQDWELQHFSHHWGKPSLPTDFENTLWLLSDGAYPWFVIAGIRHDAIKERLMRTDTYKRLMDVVESRNKIGIAYQLFLLHECGICISGGKNGY